MTCIKTGCNVYFSNYGMQARADLYRVGDCYVVRWNVHSVKYVPKSSGCDYVVLYWSNEEVWHREDLGVTVVPKEYFSAL